VVDWSGWEGWLLMPQTRRAPSAPERTAPERYQIRPAEAPLLTDLSQLHTITGLRDQPLAIIRLLKLDRALLGN